MSQSINCINDRGHGSPSTEASIHHSWQLIFLITLRSRWVWVYSCVFFQKARSSYKKDREPHWCFPNLHRLWNATLKHSSEYQYHVPRSWGVLWTRDQNQSMSSWRRELFHDSQDELKIKDFPLHNSTVQSFITCLMQELSTFGNYWFPDQLVDHISLLHFHLALHIEETVCRTAALKGGWLRRYASTISYNEAQQSIHFYYHCCLSVTMSITASGTVWKWINIFGKKFLR